MTYIWNMRKKNESINYESIIKELILGIIINDVSISVANKQQNITYKFLGPRNVQVKRKLTVTTIRTANRLIQFTMLSGELIDTL